MCFRECISGFFLQITIDISDFWYYNNFRVLSLVKLNFLFKNYKLTLILNFWFKIIPFGQKYLSSEKAKGGCKSRYYAVFRQLCAF